MKEINCNKQAEHYFLASKDKWTDADFPDLRPPDSSFQMKFKLPDTIRIGGVLHPYPMRGVPVSGFFRLKPFQVVRVLIILRCHLMDGITESSPE